MDYQEKLRLAKEALDSGSYDKETIEYIFPELKESEDERIKNEIIDYLKGFIPHHNDDLVAKSKVWIAWLEKQDPNRLEKEIELAYKTADEVQYRNGFKAGQNEVLENPQKYGLEKRGNWSEEDEKHYQGCLNLMKLSLDTKPYSYYNDYLWLKSLKQKMKGE